MSADPLMRNRYLLVADVLAFAAAAWGAFAFRFGWLFTSDRPEFIPFLLTAIVVKVAAFFFFGHYRRVWRYAGFWDLVAVVLANSAASVVLMAIMVGSRLMGWIEGLSRSVPPLDWLLTLALTLGLRASLRAVAESRGRLPRHGSRRNRRVLIIGAGDAGALVAREMQKNPQLGLQPVGFLDDDRFKANKQIYGLPVLGGIASLADVAAAKQLDEVVIAMPKAGGRTVRAVVEHCQTLQLSSRVMPGVYELLGGQLSVSRLRGVDIADLLRRPQVHSQPEPGYLKDACVLVTGAGGSIGGELCRQVAHAGPSRLVLIGHGENSIFEIAAELRSRFPAVDVRPIIADVRDRPRVIRIIRGARPDIVFHAAAHKHVPLMEANPVEAVTNNIGGTRNIVDASVAAGVQRLVMVSTDKAVAPSSIMGASKRVAESIVQRAARKHARRFVVVRFGNVLGSRGSVVPIFKAQIDDGGPVTVTHPEVRRYFMTIPEAVHLVLQAGGLGDGGELFVLDMGQPVLLRDMAADMIRLSGLAESDIPIVFTGLRQGEKLDEILCEPDALVEPTSLPDIRRVREQAIADDELLEDVVDRFADAAAREDHDRIVRLFRDYIPSATLTAPVREGASSGPGLITRIPGA